MTSAELHDVFQNSPTFATTTWESKWLFLADISFLQYTVYCDQNCTMGIRWAVDNNHQVVYTETEPVIASVTSEIYTNIKARYRQFFVNSIASNPCILRTQAFYTS